MSQSNGLIFLTHVLAVYLLMQVLLCFLLLREFLVSGNQACWLMLELGENVPGRSLSPTRGCI